MVQEVLEESRWLVFRVHSRLLQNLQMHVVIVHFLEEVVVAATHMNCIFDSIVSVLYSDDHTLCILYN